MIEIATTTFLTQVMLIVTLQNVRCPSEMKIFLSSHGKIGYGDAHTRPKRTSRDLVSKTGLAHNDAEIGDGDSELRQTKKQVDLEGVIVGASLGPKFSFTTTTRTTTQAVD